MKIRKDSEKAVYVKDNTNGQKRVKLQLDFTKRDIWLVSP